MNILILDLTHGGDILSHEYIAKGHKVTCVDVYKTASEEKRSDIRNLGVNVCDSVNGGCYDLLVAPAHCPDDFIGDSVFKKRMTFGQAVRSLIEDKRYRIEVTGVKGKTSYCYLIARILSIAGRKVYLHTSRGQGPWKDGQHIIERNMSIAPTSLLRLPKGDYDCFVTEVSLGGSGRSDISVITNLQEDYGIAKGTRKASDAKADILTDGMNIVPAADLHIWQKYGDHPFRSCKGDVKVIGKPYLGNKVCISFDYNGKKEVSLRREYLALQYIKTIELVLETCRYMNIPEEAVINGLESFSGVPGRGEIISVDDGWLINERNPGISHLSIAMTLQCLKSMDALENAIVIINPINRKVCEKMEMEKISQVISKYGVSMHIIGNENEPDMRNFSTVIRFIKEGYQ